MHIICGAASSGDNVAAGDYGRVQQSVLRCECVHSTPAAHYSGSERSDSGKSIAYESRVRTILFGVFASGLVAQLIAYGTFFGSCTEIFRDVAGHFCVGCCTEMFC
jgi:hypothetical protein